MKKLLLFAFALAIMGSTIAQKAGRQNAVPSKIRPAITKDVIEKETSNTGTLPTTLFHRELKGTRTLSKVLLGSSRNIYGGQFSYQTCLTYNMELNNIMSTFRGNQNGTIAVFGTGNDICVSISGDRGATFGKRLALSNTLNNRYPNGVIYNPAGNTDSLNAYTLVAGPRVVSSFDFCYLNTGKYDGTGQNLHEFATDPTFDQEVWHNALTATNDGKFHFSGIAESLNSTSTGYSSFKLKDVNGTWNSTDNKIDWSDPAEIITNITVSPSDNSLNASNFNDAAWSKDGTVGYQLLLGSDNRPAAKPSYVPIIYKSTNSGATWTLLPYFDWSSLSVVTDNIFPINTDTTVYRPLFEEASMVVDANNKPHIFGYVRGGYSSDLDSLGYVYIRASTGTVMDGNVMEFYLDASDAWQGVWIDSITTSSVTAAKSPYVSSPNNIGWDHRISASATDDGSKVFCFWTESDWNFWGSERYDLNPDLKGWGHDVTLDLQTTIKNFTANTDLWGLAFFHFTSKIAMTLPSGDWEIPNRITDINTSGLQADEPVYHYYVSGCTFTPADFLATNNLSGTNANNVTNCYPNPFSGLTNVDVTVVKPSNVNINVFNITGQMVLSTNYGSLSTGSHTLTIDGSRLHSGVYFYTISIGDQKFTNKIIVK